MILHHSHIKIDVSTDSVLEHTLRSLLEKFEDNKSLEVFGFASGSSIPEKYYEPIAKLLKSNTSLRILVLPESADKSWRGEQQTFFAGHVRLSRGDPGHDVPQLYQNAQADRERPTTKGEGRPRNNFDVYFHNGCHLGTINAAVSQPGTVIKEASLFGGKTLSSMAAAEDWQDMCERMGVELGDLEELGLHGCMIGPVSPLAHLKVTEKLRALTIAESVSHWNIIDGNGLPEVMEGFSINDLLAKVQAVHTKTQGTGMYRFVYRQYTRNGLPNHASDRLSSDVLRNFVRHSSDWRVLCIVHNQAYDGKMQDSARTTLEYAGLRFANQDFSRHEVLRFAQASPKLRWLGINVHLFTSTVNEHRLPQKFTEDVTWRLSALHTLRKLEVLCIYADWPGRPGRVENNPALDEAVTKVAKVLVKQKNPIKYIHVVIRNLHVDPGNWHKVHPALTYAVHETSPVTTSRVDSMPDAVYEDLETMGGGKRRWMKEHVRDVLGHLHVTKQDIREREVARAERLASAAWST